MIRPLNLLHGALSDVTPVESEHSRERGRFALILLFIVAAVSAQPDLWPAVLLPYEREVVEDSAKTSVVTRNKSEDSTFTSNTAIRLARNDSLLYINQNAVFGYVWDPIRKSQEYTLNLAGEGVRKQVLGFVDYAGLEWKPAVTLFRQLSYGNTQGKMEIGPVAGFSPFRIPLRIGIGGVATFWRDSLPSRLQDTRRINREAGVYGTLDLPRVSRSLGSIEMDFWADAVGRSMPHSRAVTTVGGAAAKVNVGWNDTAMIFVADTFANGNDAFVSNEVDRQLFVDKPTVLKNALQIMPAIHGTARLGLVPGIAYSFSLNDERYPGDAVDIRTHRQTSSGLQVSLSADSTFPLQYRGGISFVWNDMDWMHGRSFNRILSDTASKDAYNRNTGDFRRFAVVTRHQFGRDLPFWGAALNAGLDLKRESQTYSRYYLQPKVNGFDTIRNNDDNDRVNMRLSLDYRVFSFKLVDLNLRGEYGRNLTSFIRAGRSGSNSIDSMVLIGGSTQIQLLKQLTLRYSARAQVDMTRFIYPLLHTAPQERPPYSRLFNSNMMLLWQVADPLDASIEWVEGYADYGKWYGSQYYSSADTAVQANDYYAILNIAQDHTVKMVIRYRLKNIGSVSIGCEYSDLYYREWNLVLATYEVGNSDSDYRIDPFIEAKIAAGSAINLALRFKPVLIATNPDPRSLVVQYWNFAIQGKVLF